MIVDSMSKNEVMKVLRVDFDNEVYPYYKRLKNRIRVLIQNRALREKRTISLGWEDYVSSSGVKYRIHKRGNSKTDLPDFLAEFKWRSKECWAVFYMNQTVVVFQKHCLERYAERVLRDSSISPLSVLYNHLLKFQSNAFYIVLPTPTHEQTVYFGFAKALFLGDFEVPEKIDKSLTGRWLNTCISLSESRHTQEGILYSLHKLQSFVNHLGYNPFDDSNDAGLVKLQFNRDRLSLAKDESTREGLIDYLKLMYMLYQLHLYFGYTFTELFKEKIESDMTYIKFALSELGVSAASLSPFGKTNGFALKGEIDYRG